MAIKAVNALRTARLMLNTPYSDVDCIRLIVLVIRKTPGGDPEYRCEGTNWLWRSTQNSSKYRHLTWRQESISGAQAGMLAFKRDGDDVHHVGLVTEKGTVIHSSSVYGRVVETPLDGSWHLLAVHKLIEPAGETVQAEPEQTEEDENYAGAYTSLVRDDGVSILLAGSWRVASD